jgi:putative transcriptional regulator
MLAGLSWGMWAGVTPQRLAGQPPGPEPGDLLIASRRLGDANFAQAVVLLLHVGPDGAQGIVINRRTLVRVATVLPQIESFSKRLDTLYWGGPVEPRSAILLARGAERPSGAERLVDGVWVVRTREGIEELLGRGAPESSLRLFSGYAGWAPGQLERELSAGDWQVRRGDAERIFTADPDGLWKTLSQLASAQVA